MKTGTLGDWASAQGRENRVLLVEDFDLTLLEFAAKRVRKWVRSWVRMSDPPRICVAGAHWRGASFQFDTRASRSGNTNVLRAGVRPPRAAAG